MTRDEYDKIVLEQVMLKQKQAQRYDWRPAVHEAVDRYLHPRYKGLTPDSTVMTFQMLKDEMKRIVAELSECLTRSCKDDQGGIEDEVK